MKFLVSLALFWGVSAQADLNIYTDRSVELLQPLADEFEAQTGKKINILNGKYSDLVDRLEVEGESTPADLLFFKDMVYMNDLTARGHLKAHSSLQPEALVDSAMRHPENLWTGVTFRPRTLVYNTNKPEAAAARNYVDLIDETFKGKLCLRTSSSTYNVALVSSLIHNMGYDEAKKMIEAWVANLSPAAPTSDDTKALEAIAEGQCDVGLVNSYYLVRKLRDNPNFPVALTFAGQENGGVHTNGSGIGMSVHSQKTDEAATFIDFILSDRAQLHLSTGPGFYPVKKDLLPQHLAQDWGLFKKDQVNWSVLGLQHANAKRLFKEVGYL